MAILSGFPASNTISPSVRIAENDLSFIAPQATTSQGGLVGFASKGPINVPTMITSLRQLTQTFGNPHPDVGDPYLIYAAQQFLQTGTAVYIVRVAETNGVSNIAASTASVVVPTSGLFITATGSAESGGYYFPVDSFFKWRLNGVESQKTLVVPAGTYNTNDVTVDPTDMTNIAIYLNSQLDTNAGDPGFDGIQFGINTNALTVSTTFASGPNASLELVSVQNALYGPVVSSTVKGVTSVAITTPGSGYVTPPSVTFSGGGGSGATGVAVITAGAVTAVEVTNPGSGYATAPTIAFGSGSAAATASIGFLPASGVTGLATGMVQAQQTGTVSETSWVLTGDTATRQLEVVVDGTDNLLVDNVVQTITIPSATYATSALITALNDQIDFLGNGSAADVDTADGGVPGLGFYFAADTDQIVIKTIHAGKDAQLLVKPSGLCTTFGFDNLTHAGNSNTSGLYNGASNDSPITCFTINADSPGIEGNTTQVEVTNNLRENVFTFNVYNGGAQVEQWGYLSKNQNSSYYIGTYISLVSNYIQIADNTAVAASPTNGVYALAGGSDGIPSDPDAQDHLLIGDSVAYTGMYALSDSEQIDIDLLAVPGHPSTAVVEGMLDVCQNYRQDCLAIVDPPFGLTVEEIVAWQNGTHPLNADRFDSDFGALYWPWVQIYDTYNNLNVWVPPSGSVMATIARSDFLSEPWFAPAGLTRGVVPGIVNVFTRPTLTERDLMYGNSNAINPIITFPDIGGFVIWGQKTLQRLPTLLDRVNVRRLMFAIEKQMKVACRGLLFEPNDGVFAQKFVNITSAILKEIQVGRGLFDFIIDVGSDLNTSATIARNEFHANIGVQPIPDVEFIFLTFSINLPGAFTTSNGVNGF